jgi:drug/metabolite transporter (DMT)-like permease
MSAALGAHVLLLMLWQGARSKAPIRGSDLFHTGMSALLAMVVGMTLILQALKTGQANVVALLSSVTPVMILPLLWVVYRKPPAWGGWAGAVGVVAGTSLLLTR